jgi:hypothetical protein
VTSTIRCPLFGGRVGQWAAGGKVEGAMMKDIEGEQNWGNERNGFMKTEPLLMLPEGCDPDNISGFGDKHHAFL